MKKYLIISLFLLSISQLEAYTYGFTNNTDRALKVCASVTGFSRCETVPARGRTDVVIGGGRAGFALHNVSASFTDGSGGDRQWHVGSSGVPIAYGNMTFTVNMNSEGTGVAITHNK